MPGLLRHLTRRRAARAANGFYQAATACTSDYSCSSPPKRFYREEIRYMSTKDSCYDGICLFNSLSESIDPLPASNTSGSSIEEKGLAWYTCGPTTYAPAHMGHARTYVCMDILRRIIEENHASSKDTIPPLFVMNITDVDDKILAASDQTGEDPLDIARRYEVEFWEDLESLNCLKPNIVTRVSEHVESDIVPYIDKLAENGMAYELDDGIYFDIQAFNEQLNGMTQYGKLAPPTVSDGTSSTPTTIDVPDVKRDERDFALWKKRRAGEAMAWQSPWGEGRPGWHIECSAMIEAVQAKFRDSHEFRVHAGGADLQFPHHTNEIAQAEGYRQEADWIPHWVHTGHLHIDGLKMSKSLKNFVSIRDFLNSSDLESEFASPADDFRLWCLSLSGSYRDPATFSMDRIIEAQRIRAKLVQFLVDAEDWLLQSEHSSKVWTQEHAEIFGKGMMCQTAAMKALRNDLEGRAFLGELTEIVSMGHCCLASTADTPPELVTSLSTIIRTMLRVVGMSTRTTGAGLRKKRTTGVDPPSQMGALTDATVDFRDKIREQALSHNEGGETGQYEKAVLAQCDHFRDIVLPKLGVQILDGKSARWKRVVPASPNSSSIKHTPQSNQLDLSKVSIDRFFRVGRFENTFSEFDDKGIPTLNADGTEISKRAMKKLLKKREKHLLLLQSDR